MSDKYAEGTHLLCNDVHGVVIGNVKLPGDICVMWEYGGMISYDAEWLDENARIVTAAQES